MIMKNVSDNHALNKLPQRLVEKLMPFQKDGIQFAIEKKGRCLIADEMGLGKTIQAISIAYYFKEEWPLLIIVPSSLRYCWIEELEKWLPDVHPHDINLIQAGNDAGEIQTAKITIITYGLLSKQTSCIVKEALLSEHFNVVICDESHYIRNSKTASSKAVVPIIKNANRRILLSGTPALSKPVELFSQLDALCPGEFGSWWSFTTRYCAARFEYFGKQKRRKVDGASNLEELQAKLSKLVMIRREKSQVLTQLPPKQRQKILFELKDSSMKKEIISAFDELKPYLSRSHISTSELFDQGVSEERDEGKNPDVARLGLISKLYKLSGEAKIGPAKDYIGMLCDNENLKFLVFAHHRVMLNGIQQTLWEKKVKFIRIDGDTLPSDRLMYVQRFQSDPEIRVAILSILAAGVGLTFTAAKLVVFAEMHWTPGVLLQCEDRAHRIGQTGSVQIHYLVAKGTMDEWVWSAICRKTIVTSTALSGKGKNLEANKGDKYQVDVLSNADAWMPSKESQMDFVSFFQSQRSSDQSCIKDYFTPPPSLKHKEMNKSRCSSSVSKSGTQKRSRSNSGDPIVKKKQKPDPAFCSFVILDSDEEEFAFKDKKKTRNKKKLKERKHSESSSHDSSFEFDIPNFTLSTSNSSDNTKNNSTNSHGSSIEDISVSSRENEKPDVSGLMKCSDSEEKVLSDKVDKLQDKNTTLCSHQEPIPPTNESQWACPACTFLNHVDIPICEMCESPKMKRKTNVKTKMKRKTNVKTKMKRKTNVKTKMNSGVKKSLVVGSHSVSDSPMKRVSEVNNVSSQSVNNKQNSSSEETTISIENISINVDIEFDEKSSLSEAACNHVDVCTDSESLFSSSEETVVDEVASSPACVSDEDSLSRSGLTELNEDNDSDKESASEDCMDYDHKESDVTDSLSNTDVELPAMKEPRSRCKNTPTRNSLDSSCLDNLEEHTKEKHSAGHRKSPTGGTVRQSIFCSTKTELESKNADISNFIHTNAKQLFKPRSLEHTNELEISSTEVCCSSVSNGNSNFSQTPRITVSRTELDDNSEDIDQCFTLVATKGENIGNCMTPSTLKSEEIGQCMTPSAPRSEDIGHCMTPSALRSEDIRHCMTPSALRVEHHLAESTPKPLSDRTSEHPPPVHTFLYCCSRYTGRIYLFDSDGRALNENFLPLDVEMDNLSEFASLLREPAHLRQVQKFTREWNSLSDTKKRLITKRGLIFSSPILAYEEVRTDKKINTKRHKTKEDIANTAQQKADVINGSVRLIRKHKQKTNESEEITEDGDNGRGCLQAVNNDGVPLCLNCQQEYKNELLHQSTITSTANAWATRFCSKSCSDTHWMKTNAGYCRDKVYEVEHGVCRLCGVDAHALYIQLRDTADLEQRAKLINASKFSSMKSKMKEQMVKKPVGGQFWHMDHITPVWEGGGMCDIDNMRTLCTVCHMKVTSKQASKRATVRKLASAVGSADITAFFQKS